MVLRPAYNQGFAIKLVGRAIVSHLSFNHRKLTVLGSLGEAALRLELVDHNAIITNPPYVPSHLGKQCFCLLVV